MPIYKFEEQLNDLVNYFILGDPDLLYEFKESNNLPDNLVTEFTTNESGNRAVEEGVMIPLAGIDNHPYTVIISIAEDQVELLKYQNLIVHKKEDYIIYIKNECIFLYTMPYLRRFDKQMISSLKQHRKASVNLPNGWYSVDVYVGYLSNDSEDSKFRYEEPTIEFSLHPHDEKPTYKGNINYLFSLSN